MARWHTCRAYLTVQSPQHEYSREFGPGAQADFDERVAPGITLFDVIKAYADRFVPNEEAPSSTVRRAPKTNTIPAADLAVGHTLTDAQTPSGTEPTPME